MCNIDESMEIIYRTPEPIKENNGLYYIQVEMVDGTSQILQISKEQAVQLGVDLSGETPEIAHAEKNPQMQELIIDANGFLLEQGINQNVTEYRILQPEEMNLKPLKKGASQTSVKRSYEDIIIVKPAKKVKTVRTRSGRITVPPKHIQNIYKQFLEKNDTTTPMETAEVSRSPSPLLIGDFTPLTTNGDEAPLVEAAQTTQKTKNVVVNQFRCATCNKAYLAMAKMRKHFKMYPDHKPKDMLNVVNSRTWNFLIDTSKAAAVGRRGVKFCRELVNLLHNVKVLVKYVFKLQEKLDGYDDLTFKEGDTNEKGQYLMNEVLTQLLGIDKGWYTFSDKEWFKDVSIFSFLNNFDNSGGDLSALSLNDNSNVTGDSSNLATDALVNKQQLNSLEEVISNKTDTDDTKMVWVTQSGCDDENTENLIAKKPQLSSNNNKNVSSKDDEMFSKFINENMRSAKQNTAVDDINVVSNAGADVEEGTDSVVDSALSPLKNEDDSVDDKKSSKVIMDDTTTTYQRMTTTFNNVIVGENSDDDNGIIEKMMVDDSLLVVDKPPLEIFQFDSNQ